MDVPSIQTAFSNSNYILSGGGDKIGGFNTDSISPSGQIDFKLRQQIKIVEIRKMVSTLRGISRAEVLSAR